METPRQAWPIWMWIGIVALVASARLLPHPWNFTPLVATGLFAGARARGFGAGALVTLLSLAISDIALGFSRDVLFVYSAALIPVVLGRMIRSRGWAGISGAALASSVSFFVITNFMTWAMRDIYPHTMAGLAACYVAGIPFYANQLAGDVFYTAVMFGGYSLLARWLPRTPEPSAA